MIKIYRMGCNAAHDKNFYINRPNGWGCYLLLLVKTEALFQINGEMTLCQPGTAVLYSPGQHHHYKAIGDVYINDWLQFDTDINLFGQNFPFGIPVVLSSPKDCYSVFSVLYNEFMSNSAHRKQNFINLLPFIINKINDSYRTEKINPLYDSLLSLRCDIYAHPESSWKIPDLSKKLNVSTSYFHAIYYQTFNTTCINDVIESRLAYARQLLADTSITIDETAFNCGYQNVEHFIRQFKKKCGITPGKYRKNHRAGFDVAGFITK